MTARTSSRCRGWSTSTATSASVTNRAVPDVEVAAALAGLFSASAAGGTERTGDRLECVACGVGLPDELQRIAARGFMVVAQDFQDEWTLDVAKLRKCCVSQIVPDGRLIPFCAYNSVGYREQVRAEQSALAPGRA